MRGGIQLCGLPMSTAGVSPVHAPQRQPLRAPACALRAGRRMQLAYQWMDGGRPVRLTSCLPRDLAPEVASLLAACLAEEPSARPSMEQVVAALAKMQKRELPQPADESWQQEAADA